MKELTCLAVKPVKSAGARLVLLRNQGTADSVRSTAPRGVCWQTPIAPPATVNNLSGNFQSRGGAKNARFSVSITPPVTLERTRPGYLACHRHVSPCDATVYRSLRRHGLNRLASSSGRRALQHEALPETSAGSSCSGRREVLELQNRAVPHGSVKISSLLFSSCLVAPLNGSPEKFVAQAAVDLDMIAVRAIS